MEYFFYLLGRVSLCWIGGYRRVIRGGGLLFTLPWFLGWSPNKAGLRMSCFPLSLESGKSRDEMEDPDDGKG